ncbi:hypothetical protein B0H10DRAFT_1985859 [Mycena sp. CBHHK59/15]|nr:hypothetical protein B0H10DRAFT_1985859 [Mycena sp. CBHHK59/15]
MTAYLISYQRVPSVFSHPLFSTTTLSGPTMAYSPYSSRDSNSIRASVYDVFLELGALDSNSRVADWIFTDPSCVLPDLDAVQSAVPEDSVRFADTATERGHGVQRAGIEGDATIEPQNTTSRPTSSSKSFGLKFSPKRIRTRTKSKSTITTTKSSTGDGYDTDEGYQTASPSSPKSKSRVRAVFSLPSKSNPSAASNSPPPLIKPLPSLPPIREKLTRTESVARAKSLFRKKPKSPSDSQAGSDLQQWHEVLALTPRAFNPSAVNGVAAAPPSSFRPIVNSTGDGGNPSDEPTSHRLSFALPRTIFRSLSITKRRVTPRSRPPSLTLVDDPAPRFATSLPSSPFILITEGEGTATPAAPRTPFVFVTPIDNPTPLNSARRFSDVTSMTAPIYPLSIARTLRRSLILDNLEPSFPRLRSSSSYSSLPDTGAASAASESPYPLYNQAIPSIQRGREAPFPSHPVLPQPLSASHSYESRLATIQRYREFSEQLVELTPYKKFVDATA